MPLWLNQGGKNTITSYGERKALTDNQKHVGFFRSMRRYYLDRENRLFVHGGLDPKEPIESQPTHKLIWDREIIEYARHKPIYGYKEVYIGHTQVPSPFKPAKLSNLWCMDTGAGWNGKLTIMDINTKEYWQSKKQRPRTTGFRDLAEAGQRPYAGLERQ